MYISHRILHPALRKLPMYWLSGLGRTRRRSWGFQIKKIRERSKAPAGLLPSSTVSCMTTLWLVN